jgi:hypothetical protein
MKEQIERLANREIRQIEEAYEKREITLEERDADIKTIDRQAREEWMEWERERYFARIQEEE